MGICLVMHVVQYAIIDRIKILFLVKLKETLIRLIETQYMGMNCLQLVHAHFERCTSALDENKKRLLESSPAYVPLSSV